MPNAAWSILIDFTAVVVVFLTVITVVFVGVVVVHNRCWLFVVIYCPFFVC